jgi:site-specific DNA-methyltransferase (adenine-specific)
MSDRGYIAQSKTVEWATPQDLFDQINSHFHFTVDVAADASNAKCEKFYDKEADGLSKDWAGETVWCNPPYGRVIKDWVKKAADTVAASDTTTVILLCPARTDVAWFHDHCYNKPNCKVQFVRGRLKFGGSKVGAPFPSMLLIFQRDVNV